MLIPLHIKQAQTPFQRIVGPRYVYSKSDLHRRAELAFFMVQLNPNGFRKTSTKTIPGRLPDIGYVDSCLVDADIMPAPKIELSNKARKKAGERDKHRMRCIAQQRSGVSGLTNYEMGLYMLAVRARRRAGIDQPDPRDFVGCRRAL